METKYIEGDFTRYIKELGDKAQLIVVDGKWRWRIGEKEEEYFIARPAETKHE